MSTTTGADRAAPAGLELPSLLRLVQGGARRRLRPVRRLRRALRDVSTRAALVGVVGTLCGIGLVMVLSASAYTSLQYYGSVWYIFERQVLWMGLGGLAFVGAARVRGLVAVWLWTVRTWRNDESADLSATMAALDRALGHAERAAGWLGGGRQSKPETPSAEAAAGPTVEAPVVDASPPPAPGRPDLPADGQPGLEPDTK